jgi:hypothetical protein
MDDQPAVCVIPLSPVRRIRAAEVYHKRAYGRLAAAAQAISFCRQRSSLHVRGSPYSKRILPAHQWHHPAPHTNRFLDDDALRANSHLTTCCHLLLSTINLSELLLSDSDRNCAMSVSTASTANLAIFSHANTAQMSGRRQ